MRNFETLFSRSLLIFISASVAWTLALPEISRASSTSLGFYEPEDFTPASEPDSPPALDDPSNWDTFLKQHIPTDVKFGVMTGAPSSYSLNQTDPFTAASLTKLFTAAAALKTLGPEHVFTTDITWNRIDSDTVSDLTLFGSGDPTWKNSTFHEIAKQISQKGIKRILGKLAARSKDPRWDAINDPPGWNSQYQLLCYASLGHAFNISENCATLSITSVGHSHWVETGVGTSVELNLRQAASTSLRVTRKGSTYVISGTLKSHATLRLPIHDTKKWVEGALKQALQTEGIELIDREMTASENNRKSSESAQVLSAPLSEILKHFLKMSDCFYGDVLIQAVGQKIGSHSNSSETDLRKAGLEEIFTMNQKSNPFSSEIVLFDGGGLSTLNRITARATFAALESFKKEPWFATLWDALSIAGRDGTLAHRMTGTPAQDSLRGKTGTLIGFYHLAGYLPVRNPEGQIIDYLSYVFLGASTEGAARKEWDPGTRKSAWGRAQSQILDQRSPP